MRPSQIAAISAFSVSLLLVAGCSGKAHSSNKALAAPALTREMPRSRKAPVDPNAPYAVLKHRTAPELTATNATATPSEAPFCSSANLAVSEIAANGNATERTVSIAFTNKGDSACKLSGYPFVSFPAEEQPSLKSLTVLHDQNDNPEEASVLLPPKGAAFFSLRWTTGDSCPMISKLLVTAPGTTQSFSLNRPVSPCQGRVEITAIKAVPANG